jgi:hypothetical protein
MNLTNKIEGETFVGANVQIDGGSVYVKCRFVNCNLVFLGTGPVQVDRSTFEGTCRFSFGGPAANTFNFLKAMCANGQTKMVEEVFREIRGTASSAETGGGNKVVH